MIVRCYVKHKDGSITYDRPYIFTVEKIDKMNEGIECKKNIDSKSWIEKLKKLF
jgi:hypothetical protein